MVKMGVAEDHGFDAGRVNASRIENLSYALLDLNGPIDSLEKTDQNGAQVLPVLAQAEVEEEATSCIVRARMFDEEGEYRHLEELMAFNDCGTNETGRSSTMNGPGGVDDGYLDRVRGRWDLEVGGRCPISCINGHPEKEVQV